VERAENEIVVIDTAPTGHTLLLLDATQSYHKEVKRTQGDIPETVKKLLPRLRNADETEVIIVTLAETTPVYEAMRLEEDLIRAGIATKWWVINSSMYATETTNQLLKAKASREIEWINKVDEISDGHFAVIRWSDGDITGEKLLAV
jgi:arsenite-transporting ATPase